jgi:hypothetical protein
MGRYDDLLYQLIKRNLRSCFEKFSEKELESEIEKYQNTPSDYVDFLREIGYGEIGDGYFMLYSGFVNPSDIYDQTKADKLRYILFIGDDFNGRCIGFENSHLWELVEVDENQKINFLNISFEEFIRDKITKYIDYLGN